MKRDDVKSLKFFILAGGYGKRAQPLSLIKPKPVFPLDGTPLLQIMLKQLQEKGLREGFINLHHLPEALRQCAETMPERPLIQFLYEEELTGSRILKGALPAMAEDDVLLVVNGDIFLEIPVEEMLRQVVDNNDTDGILLVRRNKEMEARYKAVLTGGKPQRGSITGGNIFTGRKIHDHSDSESISESLMYTGVSLFKKKVIQAIADINFFDSLERHKYRIKVLSYDGIWLDIGDPQSYVATNFAYKSYVKANSGDSNSVSENVIISSDSMVEHSIIWENTEIKNESVIKNCIVTGNISLDHVRCQDQIIHKCPTTEFKLHPLTARPGAPL
ncbi:MAG: NTP transferase domain-containing protein [Candidatus Aminicenantes bacterium]|nr:NTP transferase domain-containing protein [Candidatus Aminicenantes bacterium]NIM85048.1 NTP transferase domain-containing protein [Candidatus Aminicenantes bacterium]NIN24562.1 NTP transferase domain-containing protein [Candidatus Aminicenantes bacterium]NIN48326.1 NTP transferase domain-containing protein [Candidatus Aminicenantes bacterium]NIN91229.1 NTP transferase domain-containing protein [Candidatus Aminicenantes bacterium]